MFDKTRINCDQLNIEGDMADTAKPEIKTPGKKKLLKKGVQLLKTPVCTLSGYHLCRFPTGEEQGQEHDAAVYNEQFKSKLVAIK